MTKRVAIIGGGASGAIVALHLAKNLTGQVSLWIFDPGVGLGQGEAYRSNDPKDLLNVPANKMSADPKNLQDFENWISQNRNHEKDSKHWPFVPRAFYALYLESRLPQNLNRVQSKVVEIKKQGSAFKLRLFDGTQDIFDFVILATGYESPLLKPDFEEMKGDILIIGSGLTAVDYWRRLRSRKNNWPKTRVHFLSRRGLLPRPHDLKVETPNENFKVFPGSPRLILKKLRDLKNPEGQVEVLRNQAGHLWRSWSQAQRKSFLTHLKPYWEVIRHRLPATIYEELKEDILSEKVKVTAGRVVSSFQKDQKYEVQIRTRNQNQLQTLAFDHVLKATGYLIDQSIQLDPELKIEKCPFGFGYSKNNCPGFWIIGPALKAQDWETTSIPDISLKALEIYQELKQSLNSEPVG